MRSVCFLIVVMGGSVAGSTAAAEAVEPEILIAPDQPVPCVYVDDPLIVSLRVAEPAMARVSLKLVDTIGRNWDLDLGSLSLPAGVERWYALKGAPAERGFYAVTVMMTINGSDFSRTVGMCRVDRPARLARSPLGLTITATPWLPELEYAVKTIGVRTLWALVPAGGIQDGAGRLRRAGLKAGLMLRASEAGGLVAQPGKLQIDEEWTGIQLSASAPELFVKFRDKTALPLWAVADTQDGLRAFMAGPGAGLAAGVILEAPALPPPAERAGLAQLNLPVSIALTDPAWVQSRPPARLMVELLEVLAAGISSVLLPLEAVYESGSGYAPPAALFNVFGSVFGQTDYTGWFTVADGVESLLFRDGPNWILVAWRGREEGDPIPVNLPLEGAVSVMVSDPFGNPVEDGVTNANGNLITAVGAVPVLIRGSGGNLIARAAATRAMEIAADLLTLPPPAEELVADGFRSLLETIRNNPAADGARARYLDLLRQWSQLEMSIARGEVPQEAGLPVSRRLVMLSQALAAVEEGRGELFLEPLSEMIAETERLQTMYLTGTPPGSAGVRHRAEQVLTDLRHLVDAADILARSGRKIEAAALASAAQHYGKCLEIYARGSAAIPLSAAAAKPEAPQDADAKPAMPTPAATPPVTGKRSSEKPDVSVVDEAAVKLEPSAEVQPSPAGEIVHIIAKGDNPTTIAKRYGVALDDLLKWNKMTRKSRLNIGDKIVIKTRAVTEAPPAGPRKTAEDASAPSGAKPETPDEADPTKPASAGDSGSADARKQPAGKPEKADADQKADEKQEPAPEGEIVHVVVKGDNPSTIAKKYGVSLDDLLMWNKMTRESRLNIGDKIIIRKGKP